MILVHMQSVEGSSEYRYQCDICDQFFNSQYICNLHISKDYHQGEVDSDDENISVENPTSFCKNNDK